MLMMTVMRSIFADKNAQEALFLNPSGPGGSAAAAGLEWTIVRPGGLLTEPPNGIINVIDGQAGSISRADVAAFCLDAVRAGSPPLLKLLLFPFHVCVCCFGARDSTQAAAPPLSAPLASLPAHAPTDPPASCSSSSSPFPALSSPELP